MYCRIVVRSLMAVVATLILAAGAQAQLFRAYLAPGPAGNDANNCTLPTPCRLLPAALAAVADGGEIWMLDSANYNMATVTISKSVSILAVPGALGSVVAAGGPAIRISADNLKVALRNLAIVPLPASAATDGITLTGNSALTIENSLIANLPADGVQVIGVGKVEIVNSTLRNNGRTAVYAQSGAQVTIAGSTLQGSSNKDTIFVSGETATTTTVIVSDSNISGGSTGASAVAIVANAIARVFLTRCAIEGTSSAGLFSATNGNGSALISASDSMITNNYRGWFQSGTGSAIKTLGNNHIEENSIASVGVLTGASLQ